MEYKISEVALNKALDYLGKRPYNEVYAVIALLLTAKPIKTGEKENDNSSSGSESSGEGHSSGSSSQ